MLERHDLQRLLKQQPEIISPDTLIIAEEFCEWEDSRKRIDLLGIDKQARLVVIELKRDETGSHMELQAIRYASMVSKLTFERAVEIYAQFLKQNGEAKDAQAELLKFLDWEESDTAEFPSDVCIVLAAAEFSKELTTSVLWLNEGDLDIRCVRMKPYSTGEQVFVDVQQIIPLPEAEDYQVRVREQNEQRRVVQKDKREKYSFVNQQYNKRKLVLAVVKAFVQRTPQLTFESLNKSFLPDEITVFCPEEKAKEIFQRTKIARYFLDEGDIITTSDHRRVAISNQWGSGINFEVFLNHARNLGFQIEKVS